MSRPRSATWDVKTMPLRPPPRLSPKEKARKARAAAARRQARRRAALALLGLRPLTIMVHDDDRARFADLAQRRRSERAARAQRSPPDAGA